LAKCQTKIRVYVTFFIPQQLGINKKYNLNLK